MQCAVVCSVRRGYKTHNVLGDEHCWPIGHLVDYSKPLPYETASRGVYPTGKSGKRKILARKRRPSQRCRRKFGAAHVRNGFAFEMFSAMIGCVNIRLLPVNIIRPHGPEEIFQSMSNEAAAGKELQKRWKLMLNWLLVETERDCLGTPSIANSKQFVHIG